MTLLYLNSCYNEVCYIGTAPYVMWQSQFTKTDDQALPRLHMFA